MLILIGIVGMLIFFTCISSSLSGKRKLCMSGVTIALEDSTRYAYIGITGEYCDISDVELKNSDTPVADDSIERIAEEISYINVPEGDIPDVQVNGWRSDKTVIRSPLHPPMQAST